MTVFNHWDDFCCAGMGRNMKFPENNEPRYPSDMFCWFINPLNCRIDVWLYTQFYSHNLYIYIYIPTESRPSVLIYNQFQASFWVTYGAAPWYALARLPTEFLDGFSFMSDHILILPSGYD